MRLIDADRTKESIPETSVDIFENCARCGLLDREQVFDLIDEQPTIDVPDRKFGEWIKDDVGVHCSECFCGWDFFTGIPVEVYGFHFCPTCGAYMQERRDRE